jgi:hypothetical protein
MGGDIEGKTNVANTSDFRLWLAENQPEEDDHEEIYALYRAAMDRSDYGIWEVTTSGAKTFIKGPEGTLQLLSEKARTAFIGEVSKLTSDPQMKMEGWYEYKRAMAKDD